LDRSPLRSPLVPPSDAHTGWQDHRRTCLSGAERKLLSSHAGRLSLTAGGTTNEGHPAPRETRSLWSSPSSDEGYPEVALGSPMPRSCRYANELGRRSLEQRGAGRTRGQRPAKG